MSLLIPQVRIVARVLMQTPSPFITPSLQTSTLLASLVAVTSDDPLNQKWILTLTPEEFMVGSTLVRFKMGDAEIKFVVTTFKYRACPYRVSLFGIPVRPVR